MKCTIRGEEFQLEQARLKLWLILGSLHDKIIKAVEKRDRNRVSYLLCLYVSTAFAYPLDKLEEAPWDEVASAYISILSINNIKVDLPITKYRDGKYDPPFWDYDGRDWYEWSHMLAKEFGWTLEYIAELDVFDALHLVQEIAVSEQLRREWEWSLSENSVGWDKASKKSKFNPLPRPSWMTTSTKAPETTRIPVFLMPVGNIISHDKNIKH